MRTITLGRTGLEVSRIAFGTWQLGGEWGSFDEEAAIAAIRRARDLGITLFDTAQAYGFGASEQLLGTALRPELSRDRESVVIATKGGIRPPERDASAAFLRRGVEESLRHLGVDAIDIYQVHWPDPDVPQEETAGALQEMVDEGKIRHVGVSNYDVGPDGGVRRRAAGGGAAAPVPPVPARDRGGDPPLRARARHRRARLQPPGERAAGGAHRRGHDLRGRRLAQPGERLHRGGAAAQPPVVRRLDALAGDLGITLGQLAIAWVLAQPGVHVAIVGARSAANIEASAAAAAVELDADALARIEEIAAEAEQIRVTTPEGVL